MPEPCFSWHPRLLLSPLLLQQSSGSATSPLWAPPTWGHTLSSNCETASTAQSSPGSRESELMEPQLLRGSRCKAHNEGSPNYPISTWNSNILPPTVRQEDTSTRWTELPPHEWRQHALEEKGPTFPANISFQQVILLGTGAGYRHQVVFSASHCLGTVLGWGWQGEGTLEWVSRQRGPGFDTYPRWRALTCRLIPTIERRTLPQFGHRHLYITFTEF